MNIQLRSYLEAELSKATGEQERLAKELAEVRKDIESRTRINENHAAFIAGLRKLLAKADAEEVATPANKDAQEGDKS